MSGKALFLDRDGVINHDGGYIHTVEAFEFMPGIFALCQAAVGQGYQLVVVTNQSGIGRGMYDEQAFAELTDWMKQCFVEHQAPLSAVYYCPFHPEAAIEKYRLDSPDRKPAPGMLLRAQRELGLDMAVSLLVGDRPSDIQAGRAAGVGLNVLYSKEEKNVAAGEADVIVNRLQDVIRYL